jgi:hypothetical protein
VFRWDTLYGTYFSNLSESDVANMHGQLSTIPRYRGYLDVTFSGEARDYVAGVLTFNRIFFDGNVLLSHGGDEPLIGGEDPLGFAYEDHGFRLSSVIDYYAYPFLDYKIESHATRGFDADSILSLAAATGELIDARFVDVYVHPDKLEKYLLRDKNKLALMTSIGLQEVDANGLGEIVSEHLQANYIYDMKTAPDGTATFAISAEFEKPDGGPTRRLIALKLDATAGRIALTTMY